MQILGAILCIFNNSPLLLRIPQKTALLFGIILCSIPYGASEYKRGDTANNDIFDAESGFAAGFRTFFLFFWHSSLVYSPIVVVQYRVACIYHGGSALMQSA